jgi:hypothetical protein
MTLALAVILALASSPKVPKGPDDPAHAQPSRIQRDLVFEVPEAFEEAKVPGDLEAIGIPVQLRAYRSSATAGELLDYFVRAFSKAQLFVLPPKAAPDNGWGPTLVGYDPDTRISYTVMFQANKDLTTTVILGKARLAEQRDTSKDQAIAPVFPGSADFIQTRNEAVDTMSYTAPASPEELRRFYAGALTRAGFRQLEPEVYSNQRESLTLRISDPEGKNTHARVLLVRQQHPPLAQEGGAP